MSIVFAKHPGDSKEYIFECRFRVEEGDCLIVDTKRGKQLAVATSKNGECSEYIVKHLGAYFPLREVLMVVTEEYAQLAKLAIEKNLIKKEGLPF